MYLCKFIFSNSPHPSISPLAATGLGSIWDNSSLLELHVGGKLKTETSDETCVCTPTCLLSLLGVGSLGNWCYTGESLLGEWNGEETGLWQKMGHSLYGQGGWDSSIAPGPGARQESWSRSHQTGNTQSTTGVIQALASPPPSPLCKYLVGNCKCFIWQKKPLHYSYQFQISLNLLLVIQPMAKASYFQPSHSQNQTRLCSGKRVFLIKATAYLLAVGRNLLWNGMCTYVWFAKFIKHILQFTYIFKCLHCLGMYVCLCICRR